MASILSWMQNLLIILGLKQTKHDHSVIAIIGASANQM